MNKQIILALHGNRKEDHILYIMLDAIDYYEEDCNGSSWIYLRGGNAVNVLESPQAIANFISRILVG